MLEFALNFPNLIIFQSNSPRPLGGSNKWDTNALSFLIWIRKYQLQERSYVYHLNAEVPIIF